MVELADEMDGAVEGEEVAMAMVADIHQVAAGGAFPVEDVELPGGEVGLLRPVMRHGDDLRVDPDSRGVVLKAREEDAIETRWFLAPCLAVELSRCQEIIWTL
jgi:hypothetical protein